MSLIESIPETHEQGFVKLYLMDSSSFVKLQKALTGAKTHYSFSSFATHISQLTDQKRSQIEEILSSVGSLNSIIERYEAKPIEVAKNISELLKQNKKIKFDTERTKRFERRITKLLENEQLYIAYKTITIYAEHKNLYISSKIISDIRPIFTKPNIDIKASLIANTLHIHYVSGEQSNPHKDFFIALDTKDIRNFKKVLTRAEQKIETLKRMIKKSGMTHLDPSEED